MTDAQLFWLLIAVVTDADWVILHAAYYRPQTDVAVLHMLAARYGIEVNEVSDEPVLH